MKYIVILIFVSILAFSDAGRIYFEIIDEEWETWKFQHGKKYDSDEEEHFRMRIFMENKRYIAKHNALYYQGIKNYTLKMNHFGDLLQHEFNAMVNGYRQDLKNEKGKLNSFLLKKKKEK